MREQLAALCHDQWSGWMKYLFSRCRAMTLNGEVLIPTSAVKRWIRQMNTPYEELSEEEKESDRKEADKFLEVLKEDKPPKCTSEIHGIKKLGGFSICPDCDKNLYPNDIEEG